MADDDDTGYQLAMCQAVPVVQTMLLIVELGLCRQPGVEGVDEEDSGVDCTEYSRDGGTAVFLLLAIVKRRP